MAQENLEGVRQRIREIDRQILSLAAERQRLAREVGEIKRRVCIATVDYAQERAVLERARATATEHGLAPSIAEDLLARLIRASVNAQDQDSIRCSAAGAGQSVVVVGGEGHMGR